MATIVMELETGRRVGSQAELVPATVLVGGVEVRALFTAAQIHQALLRAMEQAQAEGAKLHVEWAA